jgi:hypothetical protein
MLCDGEPPFFGDLVLPALNLGVVKLLYNAAVQTY